MARMGPFFMSQGKNLEKKFEGNLYLCLTSASSKSFPVLIFGHKIWLHEGDAGGDGQK